MTLADSLKQTVFNARGIAGTLGFRTHTAALFTDFEGGGNSLVPLVEGSGQPPKIVWTKDEDNPHDAGPEDTIVVGPITPAFTGGGTDLELLTADVFAGTARYLLITGPRHPDGAKYRITNVDAQKALRYMIRAQSEARGLAGFYHGV